MTTLQNLGDQIEGLPGYDIVVDKFNEYAGDHFKTKDPYTEELSNGKTRKRKLNELLATKDEQKYWKKIQKRAWIDDKCFMGCYPVDCGLGLGPIVILIPVIGPLLMWSIHTRLLFIANQKFKVDTKTTAKIQANILFDFLISLPPVIGSFFSWMNSCSTRNAAILHTMISKNY
ncbi:unnamed protein product [[Candida] boidinii]|nr:unnamed protein product [[Candida] boidinii]